MKPELKKFPAKPSPNNSAGRLLALMDMLPVGKSVAGCLKDFYSLTSSPKPRGVFGGPNNVDNSEQCRAYLDFTAKLGDAFDEFIGDLENSQSIPDSQRTVIRSGIAGLLAIVYSLNPNQQIRALQPAERSLLQMAGDLLEAEPELESSDSEKVRDSLEELRETLEASDISRTAKIAMLEVARLSRNALDQYTIHGARGFKKAFKKMLAEMMEVFLDEGQEVTKKAWWAKALAHVRLIDGVAAKLLKYKPVLESAGKLFLTQDDLSN